MRPQHELADIIRQYGGQFDREHEPLGQHKRVLSALAKCRTAALGGHMDTCDRCGHERLSYNSCRNRHCPKCQGTNRERWILARQQDLLPVTYFHVVFTIPDYLNDFCLHHPKELYDILFQASWETVMQLGEDPTHLGAKTGLIAILHTWGQQLWLHPHVHCIVPGGGITQAGHWKHAKNKGRYLFPVKAMSLVFRGKFIQKLKAYCLGNNQSLDNDLLNNLYRKEWVVYAKQPFRGPEQVIEYLGRYTHRIAISNHRIKAVSDGKVTFNYKDYRQGGNQKATVLQAGEFLRRFCLHILPPRFVKIRHYGILAGRAKPRLKMQQMKMGVSIVPKEKLTWQQISRQIMGFDPEACPCCRTGRMHTIMNFGPNAPPVTIRSLLKE
jgi:hypothetical protein